MRNPAVHGDAVLNGAPSIPFSVRFGDKGPLWLEFTVRTPGAYRAHTHASRSATVDQNAGGHELAFQR
jgi:succinyl-diaminopimelate desuccinylase